MMSDGGAAARVRTVALVASTTLIAGCASNPGPEVSSAFDRHYGAREWDAAIEAFEADSSLYEDDWALYRAALIYAGPESDAHDGEAAVRLLDLIVERHPESAYAASAAVVRQLVVEAGETSDPTASEAGLYDPDAVLYRTGLTYADPENELFDPGSGRRVLGELIDRFPRSDYAAPARVVRGLLAELGRSARAAAALREQLDQLKEVDLRKPKTRPPPPPPISPPDRD